MQKDVDKMEPFLQMLVINSFNTIHTRKKVYKILRGKKEGGRLAYSTLHSENLFPKKKKVYYRSLNVIILYFKESESC